MSKFYGKVGYAISQEKTTVIDGQTVGTGIWEDTIVERSYYGDVIRNSSKWDRSEGINDDLTIENKFSILADPYAYQNFSKIKYIEWMSQLWKVTSVEVERPRLTLSIGGEWNGQQN